MISKDKRVKKMMSKKQFNDLMKSLKNIENKLEIIIRMQKSILPKPNIGEEEEKILKLCDKKHTIEDIINSTGKSKTNVETILSRLRKKALIQSIQMKGRQVYEKI